MSPKAMRDSERSRARWGLPRALRDHLWTACDVARRASWSRAPQLTDLLAGGRRRGMNESPDCFYTVGFLHLRPGLRYRVELPASDAFYAVVSLHSPGRQSSCELVAETPGRGGVGIPSTAIELSGADGSPGERVVDTTGFDGLVQIMVRLYFDHRHDPGSLPLPTVTRLGPERAGRSTRVRTRLVPAGLIAGLRFLLWRVKPLLVIRWVLRSPEERLPRNRFLGFADVRSLWKGGDRFVRRIGVESFKYLFCVYDLEHGEALQVRYREPHGRYFAFSLTDPGLQGTDHRRGRGYLASHELRPDADGGCTLVLGSLRSDDVQGLRPGGRRGLLAFREILPADQETRPEVCVIPVETIEKETA